MTNYFKTRGMFLAVLMSAALLIISCGEDEVTIETPVVDFTAAVDPANTMSVIITNNSFDADSYSWDFGDGTGTSSDKSPTAYTYAASGTFTITLTATNEGGSEEATQDVTVEPIVDFTVTVDPVNSLMISLTNNSIDAGTYAWDFGDGTGTSDETNPTYTYDADGTYMIKLTATNPGGSKEVSKEVTVAAAVVVPDLGENLLSNGDMADETAWTSSPLWTADDNATNHRFENGTFIFENGEDTEGNKYQWSNHVFYQEVQLTAGKTYEFGTDVSSTSGTNATWFEVYLVKEEPVDESNIGGDAIQLAIKSFGDGEDCTNAAFSGDILDIAALCSGINDFSLLIGADGRFTVTADDLSSSGSLYLVFKAGSGYAPDGVVAGFNDGIVIDNVRIQEVL